MWDNIEIRILGLSKIWGGGGGGTNPLVRPPPPTFESAGSQAPADPLLLRSWESKLLINAKRVFVFIAMLQWLAIITVMIGFTKAMPSTFAWYFCSNYAHFFQFLWLARLKSQRNVSRYCNGVAQWRKVGRRGGTIFFPKSKKKKRGGGGGKTIRQYEHVREYQGIMHVCMCVCVFLVINAVHWLCIVLIVLNLVELY